MGKKSLIGTVRLHVGVEVMLMLETMQLYTNDNKNKTIFDCCSKFPGTHSLW